MAGVFTTTLTQAEIFYGLALLPEGRRRDDLLAAARPMFDVDLAGRVLPFDTDAASAYPEIAAGRKRSEEHTSELPSLMRNTYAVCSLTKKHHVKRMITT